MNKAVDKTLSELDKDELLAHILKQNEFLEQQIESISREYDAVVRDNEILTKDLARTQKESLHWQDEWGKLVEQIKIMNARYFGAKSEKVMPAQISLFNDMEAACDHELEEPKANKVLPKKKRKKKSTLDYSKFETVVITHEIAEEERSCVACGATMEEMGIEVKRIIRLVPAHLTVEEHRRQVYVCSPCSKKNTQDAITPVQILKAPMPTFPIDGSVASPSLLAHILYNKYALAQPVYRIANDLKLSTGLTLTRQTLGNWVIRSYERWLAMLYSLMKREILKRNVLHIDESGIQVLKEPGRSAAQRSYMWLFTGAACDKPLYLFEYNETRSRKVITDFLGDWSGTIVADGYSAYDNLGENIVRSSCLVHIRRKFTDIVKGVGKDTIDDLPGAISGQALEKIGEIFHIDSEFDDMDADTRKAARLKKLKPQMDAFYSWCLKKRDEALPKMALHGALNYAIGQWPKLMNVLADGRVPLDNNRAEQALRPFCVGRKNWLFSDTPRGADASAAIYSIVTTAKGNGLKPREYLTWLFEEMPNTNNLDDEAVLARFLPWSDTVPDNCRIESAEDETTAEPLDEPIYDIDPTILNKD